ncbi:hypothetical protein TNCV_244481 [Trichonephila clavipes]|uniref:Uncharacterized protein n=1 Tax=Trichonephila clavipes TaxID=2585209 RepID=A0A8X6UXL5_TRICX|nr:hypothetical protein TNCV_244481 [Trichonephila clavipes]
MADKDILEFVQSSKNIIEADSDHVNEMNYAAPVTMSSEMKSISSYLDSQSNGEMYNKRDSNENLLRI